MNALWMNKWTSHAPRLALLQTPHVLQLSLSRTSQPIRPKSSFAPQLARLKPPLPICSWLGHSRSFANTRPELPDEEVPVEKKKQVLDLRNLRNSRAVYAAGLSSTGALCIRNLQHAPEVVHRPRRITPLNTTRCKRVAAGCGFSLFASRKELFGVGLNQFHQLGGSPRRSGEAEKKRNDWHLWTVPIPLPSRAGHIIDISAGRLHSVVATSAGGVFCLGDNSHGQCGLDPAKQKQATHQATEEGRQLLPVEGLPLRDGGGGEEEEGVGVGVRQVHCSLDTTFVLMENGELYSFGLGTDGQLGGGNAEEECRWTPRLVEGDVRGERIRRIAGSTDTLVAVSEAGDLFMWGQNEYGQMGLVSAEPQVFHPQHIPLKLGRVKCAAATGCSVLVCNAEGEAFAWGAEVLGFGPAVRNLDRPMRFDPPLFSTAGEEEAGVEWVYAGSTMMAAVTREGHIFTWGQNRHGNLALGHEKHQYFPFQVFLPEPVRHASFGPTHSLFLIR